jgi:hypothetical protein
MPRLVLMLRSITLLRSIALLRSITVCLLLIGAGSTCFGCAGRRAPEPEAYAFDRQAEDKAVYEAVLLSMWVGERVENVVLNPTSSGAAGETYRLQQEFPGLRPDTLRDYRAKSELSARLPADLQVGKPINWYTDAEFEKALRAKERNNTGFPLEDTWEAVRKRWPNWSGWITLGNVGFSRDGQQALVDTGAGFAGLSASWHVVLLQKQDGVWKVIDEYESARA